MNTDARLYQDLEGILYSREQIHEAVCRIGKKITEDYDGREPVMVGILKGASVFFADLIREIDLPLSIDFMALSSYGNATRSSGVVRILKDLDRDIVDKDVLIVEDIVDSGLTLSHLQEVLATRGANSIRVAALLNKKLGDQSRKKLVPDYCCFEVPDKFVVGYGLDYAQKYRNLPDIGVLARRIYEK